MGTSPNKRDGVTRQDVTVAAMLFAIVTFGAWLALPAPRWALVTLGAAATLLLVCVIVFAFPISRRIALVTTITCFIGHGVATTFTLDNPPALSLGDPPGRMLSSFSLQSASHSIRYRVPFPKQRSERMRVRLLLARGYEGPVSISIDIAGVSGGVMQPLANGNMGEREYVFASGPFHNVNSAMLTITQDGYDPYLRIAIWKSDLGRTIPGEAEYASEFGAVAGIPDPMTGAMSRAWPLVWIQDA